MNLGLTTTLKESFPNVTPILRPLIINQEIPDIHLIIGFSEGESCFLWMAFFVPYFSIQFCFYIFYLFYK